MSDYLLEESPLSSGAIYRLFCGTICPRPIAWVSTHDLDGNTNLAPFSFFNVVSVAPPVLGFSPLLNGEGQPKDTIRNLEQVPECVVHISVEALKPIGRMAGSDYARTTDLFGLERPA